MAIPVTRGKIIGPERCVIYGPEGIGKTSLAAKFPRPLFIDVEGGTRQLDVVRAPEPKSWQIVFQIVHELTRDPQGFQTLVVDTADWAERLCSQHIIAEGGDKIKSLEDFGYGKGFTKLAEEYGRFLDALNQLRMHVVLTAHAWQRKIELPEETGRFDHYELKLSKQVAPLVKEWCGILLFVNYEIYVVEDAKTKTNKAQGGRRVMHTSHSPAWDAKNRHELPEKLDLDFAPIAHCFPVPEARIKEAPGHVAPMPTPEPDPTTFEPLDTTAAKLKQLMQHSGITPDQLMGAVAARGHFPANTPIQNLPDDYILGMIIPNWDKVVQSIKEKANV